MNSDKVLNILERMRVVEKAHDLVILSYELKSTLKSTKFSLVDLVYIKKLLKSPFIQDILDTLYTVQDCYVLKFDSDTKQANKNIKYFSMKHYTEAAQSAVKAFAKVKFMYEYDMKLLNDILILFENNLDKSAELVQQNISLVKQSYIAHIDKMIFKYNNVVINLQDTNATIENTLQCDQNDKTKLLEFKEKLQNSKSVVQIFFRDFAKNNVHNKIIMLNIQHNEYAHYYSSYADLTRSMNDISASIDKLELSIVGGLDALLHIENNSTELQLEAIAEDKLGVAQIDDHEYTLDNITQCMSCTNIYDSESY